MGPSVAKVSFHTGIIKSIKLLGEDKDIPVEYYNMSF